MSFNIGKLVNFIASDDSVKNLSTELAKIGTGTGGSGPTLAGTFTVSGNTVIQPTAVDLTTGNFTCTAHGLATGNKIIPVVADGSLPTVLPFELFSQAVSSTNKIEAVVIDANTFQIRYGSAGTPLVFTNASNTTTDATKFWFEKNAPTNATISGLNNLNNIQIEMYGKMWNTSYNIYLKLFSGANEILHSTGQANTSYQTIFDGNWTADAVRTNGTITVKNNATILDTWKSYHLKAQADYDYLKANPGLFSLKYTTPNTKTIGFMPRTRNITSIQLVDQSQTGQGVVTGTGGLCNGFTINVYDLGN